MAYQISQLRDTIRYYFRVARIRVNLAKTSGEMGAYGEDYVKMLADAIANGVDKITKEQRVFNEDAANENSPVANPSLYRYIVGASPNEVGHLVGDPLTAAKEKLRNIVE